MKPKVKAVIVLLILLLEAVAVVVWPRFSAHGPVLDESYRHEERFDAFRAWSRDQTSTSKAAFDSEVRLLDAHISTRQHLVFATALAINTAAIYCFWRYAPTKKRA